MPDRIPIAVEVAVKYPLDVLPKRLPVVIQLPHIRTLIQRHHQPNRRLKDFAEGVGRWLHETRAGELRQVVGSRHVCRRVAGVADRRLCARDSVPRVLARIDPLAVFAVNVRRSDGGTRWSRSIAAYVDSLALLD